MPYIPHTKDDVQKMLQTIGIDSIEDLFDEIPKDLLSSELNQVPLGRGEMEVMRIMSERAEQDAGLQCFLGAGAYEHHIPAAIWDLAGRGEFMTAYTPYQAEASQGTLQIIYEYQSMLAHLMEMDVSNASMYDGASALSEAILMAVRANRKSKSRKILIPSSVHPSYRSTADAIVKNQNIELISVPYENSSGTLAIESLQEFAGEDITALVLAQPNFFGNIEDVNAITNWAHENKILVIAAVNPIAMAMLLPPGEWGENGADIVIGEGQPLGVPMASGGPFFGFMCCKQSIVRQMPGRIIGRTVDLEGKEGFALTLQAREQHIRRSKATSNICTNQGWAVTAATMYMGLMGPEGLSEVSESCHSNLCRLKEGLSQIEEVSINFESNNFHELVFTTPMVAEDLVQKMLEKNILAGISLKQFYPDLEKSVLVCVTETKSEDDIDNYLKVLETILEGDK